MVSKKRTSGRVSETQSYQNISEHACRCEGQRHIRESIREHWPDPMGLVMNSRAKSVKSDTTQDNDDDHQNQTELGLALDKQSV